MRTLYRYILSDYGRYYGQPVNKFIGGVKATINALFAVNHCFTYSFWLRVASIKNPFQIIGKLMHRRLTRSYGIQIPRETKIGYGFYIGHGVGIIINGGTIIGNNCNISQFLTIGTNKRTPAVIGDNVYIGPSVCIVENVNIGNNSSIGAGSVVVKDVPENATVVGVPAKVLNYDNPGRFVNRRYILS